MFKSDGVGHLRLDVPLASPPTAKEKKRIVSQDEDECNSEHIFFFVPSC